MASRRFLPALRGPSQGMETKQIYVSGRSGYSPSSVQTFGRKDRTAGWDMDTVIEDGYERVVWLFKAIEVISGNQSRLPFVIMGPDGAVTSHPLLRAMNKQANPLETGRAFRKRLSAQVLLSKKGAFVEVTKNRRGLVTRLDLLDPSRVRIVADMLNGDYIQHFEFTRHDGKVRELAPEKVRWIREPHPIDPFSGVTPLEAAGMSVELDKLAREYNVSFINRDGRPGGILGVDADDLDDDELDRIQNRLKPGAQFAGEIAAIGTGPGGINYVDTASKPRDMAYGETSEKAKKEILAAFGVPESLAGDASGRTWDNAEQEALNFWQDPMLPHLELLASAFDADVAEDEDCGFDTSKVEPLELPDRRRREEARTEWREGLITIKEYREKAKKDPIDNAHTRALWINPSKAPVPMNDADKAELGLGDDMGGGDPMAPGADPMVPEGGGTAADVLAEAVAEGGVIADPAATVAAAGGAAEAAVAQALADDEGALNTGLGGAASDALELALMEGKVLIRDETADPDPDGTYDPGEADARRVELAVAAALDAMLARQAGVVAARIESPKARKGTPFWELESKADDRGGDDPIDTEKVVDPARWTAEMQETLKPLAVPAAQESSNDLLAALAAAGALVVAQQATADVVGRTTDGAQATAEQIAQAAAQAGVAPAMLALMIAQDAFEDWMAERIDALNKYMVESRPSLPDLIEQVKREWAEHSRPFSESLSVTVAQTVVGGARDAAVEQLVPADDPDVPVSAERSWRTRGDETVRATHRVANGQTRPVGEPFDVGGYPVRFPSDPLAPPSVSRYCRCWLEYRWPAGAKFTLPQPTGA